MRRTPRNLVFHELIGLRLLVLESPDPGLRGVEGIIVDETRNLLVIRSGGRLKKILKKGSTFLITLPDGRRVVIQGDKIIGRPEERVKRAHRR